MMTNRARRPIYTGVTNSLVGRVKQHKERKVDGYSKKYHLDRLVYFEHFTYIEDAIEREKQIKRWHREKKIKLIESMNPQWLDLYDDIMNGSIDIY